MLLRRALRSPAVRRAAPRALLLRREGAREFFHLPALGLGAKLLASVALKKVAMHSVLRKLGVRRTVEMARESSRRLHAAQPRLYPSAAHQRAIDGLDSLERSLDGVREDEVVRRAWAWFQSLEKNDPTLASALLKAWLETTSPVKWASTLLSAAAPAAPTAEPPPPPQQQQTSHDQAEVDQLIRKLHAAAPELDAYHVVLVPKETVPKSHDTPLREPGR